MTPKRRAVLVGAALLLLAAGCNGTPGTDGSPSPQTVQEKKETSLTPVPATEAGKTAPDETEKAADIARVRRETRDHARQKAEMRRQRDADRAQIAAEKISRRAAEAEKRMAEDGTQ